MLWLQVALTGVCRLVPCHVQQPIAQLAACCDGGWRFLFMLLLQTEYCYMNQQLHDCMSASLLLKAVVYDSITYVCAYLDLVRLSIESDTGS